MGSREVRVLPTYMYGNAVLKENIANVVLALNIHVRIFAASTVRVFLAELRYASV